MHTGDHTVMGRIARLAGSIKDESKSILYYKTFSVVLVKLATLEV